MEVNPNSQQQTGVNTATNALGNVQRPGEYLCQVRLKLKKELADISAELNIPMKTLIALEKDAYNSLPEATFIKGYYRIYAKYLKVDATAIIQRFDDIYTNDTGLLPNHALNNSPIKFMGKLPGSNRDRNRKWIKRFAIAFVVILIIWGLIAAIQNFSKSSESEKPVENTGQSDVQILNMDESSNVSGDQLVLRFNRPTSVNIVDSTGKVLATGRQSSELTLHGETPFQIRLDDASAVSLSLNSESISLSPYTVNGKAEFRLSR